MAISVKVQMIIIRNFFPIKSMHAIENRERQCILSKNDNKKKTQCP